MHAGGRDQIGAVEDGVHEFVGIVGQGAAKRAGVRRSVAGQRQQSPHVDAHQLRWRNANHGRQRAIDAQDPVGLIVGDDEIADGIENFHPVTIRLLDPGKEARILQGHGGVTSHGFQKDAVLLI